MVHSRTAGKEERPTMYRHFSYFFLSSFFLLGLSKITVSPVCVYLTAVSERASSLSHSAEREGLRPRVCGPVRVTGPPERSGFERCSSRFKKLGEKQLIVHKQKTFRAFVAQKLSTQTRSSKASQHWL